MTPRRRTNDRGLSLLEVAIVLVVIAVCIIAIKVF
jgi:prepilin-type N-terminal cleavage/methylation domain-containing protein